MLFRSLSSPRIAAATLALSLPSIFLPAEPRVSQIRWAHGLAVPPANQKDGSDSGSVGRTSLDACGSPSLSSGREGPRLHTAVRYRYAPHDGENFVLTGRKGEITQCEDEVRLRPFAIMKERLLT